MQEFLVLYYSPLQGVGCGLLRSEYKVDWADFTD